MAKTSLPKAVRNPLQQRRKMVIKVVHMWLNYYKLSMQSFGLDHVLLWDYIEQKVINVFRNFALLNVETDFGIWLVLFSLFPFCLSPLGREEIRELVNEVERKWHLLFFSCVMQRSNHFGLIEKSLVIVPAWVNMTVDAKLMKMLFKFINFDFLACHQQHSSLFFTCHFLKLHVPEIDR